MNFPIKRGSWFVALMALLGAGASDAAEGLYLSWQDCAVGATATSDVGSLCNTNAGTRDLFVAFTLDAPLDSVVAVEAILDVQHSDPALPPWWQLAPGQCRYQALQTSGDFGGRTACRDFWNGDAGAISPPAYFVNQPRGAASQARIVVTLGVAPNQPRDLDSTTDTYYAARLVLGNDATDVCTGCLAGACIVLNSIRIGRIAGEAGPVTVTLETPGPANANWVTWQGGAGASCAAVPARNLTWGRVKTLYR